MSTLAEQSIAPREGSLWIEGVSLESIARRFGTTVRALAEANGMAVEQALRIGRELRVPD